MTYTKHRSTQETLQVLDSLELDTVRSTTDDIIKKFDWEDDFDLITRGHLSNRKRLMTIIWQLFEEPRSSIISRIIAVISMCFILLSIASFILRTLTIFEIADYDFITIYTSNNLTEQTPVNNRQQREMIRIFDIIELICMKKKKFVKFLIDWISFFFL
jgi:potassium voltage-gated channel Shaw-related subfamily C protein